jgi:hypothetical protein
VSDSKELRDADDRRQVERRKHVREEWGGEDRRTMDRRSGQDRRVD